jgi:hypothetical protein
MRRRRRSLHYCRQSPCPDTIPAGALLNVRLARSRTGAAGPEGDTALILAVFSADMRIEQPSEAIDQPEPV